MPEQTPAITLYHWAEQFELWHGDALAAGQALAPGSVQAIVTSPPYFGLRDYGVTGQLGGEETPQEYVDAVVAVFDALWPVLADDGLLWLNLGDSYSVRGSSRRPRGGGGIRESAERERGKRPQGVPRKSLVGVPWRVALALMDAGWILRSEVIWHKPNPMPESVRDRPTKAHEHVFMFAKSERYHYDAAAVAEPVSASSLKRLGQPNIEAQAGSSRANENTRTDRPMRAVGGTETRNRRDVWTVPTVPFSAAHFATYPPELIRVPILASTRAAGRRCDCAEVIRTPTGEGTGEPDPSMEVGRAGMERPRGEAEGSREITRRQQRADALVLRGITPGERLGLVDATSESAFEHYLRTDRAGARPLPPEIRAQLVESGVLTDVTGECEHPVMPADLVLDPFSGSGTTGMVALQEGRRYAGIDLSAEYLDLSLQTRLAE